MKNLDGPIYEPRYAIMTAQGEVKALHTDREQATAEAKRLGLRCVKVAHEVKE